MKPLTDDEKQRRRGVVTRWQSHQDDVSAYPRDRFCRLAEITDDYLRRAIKWVQASERRKWEKAADQAWDDAMDMHNEANVLEESLADINLLDGITRQPIAPIAERIAKMRQLCAEATKLAKAMRDEQQENDDETTD